MLLENLFQRRVHTWEREREDDTLTSENPALTLKSFLRFWTWNVVFNPLLVRIIRLHKRSEASFFKPEKLRSHSLEHIPHWISASVSLQSWETSERAEIFNVIVLRSYSIKHQRLWSTSIMKASLHPYFQNYRSSKGFLFYIGSYFGYS